MFAQDQPLIARHAESPQGFADVVTFVICSQNQHFYRVGTILNALHTRGLDDCGYLNGHQKRGIAYVTQHAGVLRAQLRHQTDLERMRLLIELPSLGIVKAGFVVQLVFGSVGCLDRHNLKVLGLDARSFNRAPVSSVALTARLQMYLSTCALLGTSETIYDGWCSLIATRYPQHFSCACAVSSAHVLLTRSTPNTSRNCLCR